VNWGHNYTQLTEKSEKGKGCSIVQGTILAFSCKRASIMTVYQSGLNWDTIKKQFKYRNTEISCFVYKMCSVHGPRYWVYDSSV